MKTHFSFCLSLCLCLWIAGCASTPTAWRHPDHSDSERLLDDETYCRKLTMISVSKRQADYEEERRTRKCEDCSIGQSIMYSLAADFLTSASVMMQEDMNFASCMRGLGYEGVYAATYSPSAPLVTRDTESAARDTKPPPAPGTDHLTRHAEYPRGDKEYCESECRYLFTSDQLGFYQSIGDCIMTCREK